MDPKRGKLLRRPKHNFRDIEFYGLDSENAISRANFIQFPSYRSAKRLMNHVFCSFKRKSLYKSGPHLQVTL